MAATTLTLALIAVNLSARPSAAANARFYASLSRLDPQTRLEQVCDMEAMARIGREHKSLLPDRAKSDASSAPETGNHTMTAKGAAFRSHGHWYALSFTCKASPDHMKVTSFEYQLGDRIPESKWSEYGLWR